MRVRVNSLRVKRMASNITVVLTTDNGLLAFVRNWLYAARSMSSHAAYRRLKTPVKTPLIDNFQTTYSIFHLFFISFLITRFHDFILLFLILIFGLPSHSFIPTM